MIAVSFFAIQHSNVRHSQLRTLDMNQNQSNYVRNLFHFILSDLKRLSQLHMGRNANEANFAPDSHIGKQKYLRSELATPVDIALASNLALDQNIPIFHAAEQFRSCCKGVYQFLSNTPVIVKLSSNALPEENWVNFENNTVVITFSDNLFECQNEDDVLGIAIDYLDRLVQVLSEQASLPKETLNWYSNNIDSFEFMTSDILNSNQTDKAHILAAALLRAGFQPRSSENPSEYVTKNKINGVMDEFSTLETVPLPYSPPSYKLARPQKANHYETTAPCSSSFFNSLIAECEHTAANEVKRGNHPFHDESIDIVFS